MSGIPVVISDHGIPVRAVERGAPLMTVADNGSGIPIRLADYGTPFVVEGLYSLTVLGLNENRVYQRSTDNGSIFGKGYASVPVTVEMKEAFTSLEYSLRDADDSSVITSWVQCSSGGSSGNLYLDIECPARVGRYILDFRVDESNQKVARGNIPFSVGAVIFGMGQSQMERSWSDPTAGPTAMADLGVNVNPNGWVRTTSEPFRLPVDGSDFNSPFSAEFLGMEIARRGVSVAFVGTAQGNTAIGAWVPGSSLFNRALNVLQAVGGFEGFIWHLGGTDAGNGTTAEDYSARLSLILDGITERNSRGASYDAVITAMANRRSDGWVAVQRIRRAAKAVADSRENAIYCEPRDIILVDSVHQNAQGNVYLAWAVSRHFAAIGAGKISCGPNPISAEALGPVVTINFEVDDGLQVATTGNWITKINIYPAGVVPSLTSSGRLAIASGRVLSQNQLEVTLTQDPGADVNVYVYNHPDPAGVIAFTDRISDDYNGDGVGYGRQAVPTTDGPLIATYTSTNVLLPAEEVTFTIFDAPNAEYANGLWGQALSTLNTGYRLLTPGSVIPQTVSFAMECWFKTNFSHSEAGYIFGEQNRVSVVIDGGAGNTARLTVGSNNVSTSVVLNDDVWHHLAVQYDATNRTSTLYVDGKVVASRVATMSTSGSRFMVGGWISSNRYRSRGLFEGVAVWKGVRFTGTFTPSATPISVDSPMLLALWQFDGTIAPSLRST